MSWLRNRYVLIGILVFFLLISWRSYEVLMPGIEEKVDWVYDYDDALNKAKTEDKTLLIYFYTSVCGWCKKLSRDTFSNDEVADLLNNNFICLKIDAEEHSNLVTLYGISGYPTMLFLSPEEKVLGRIRGYKPPNSFINVARQFILNG